MGRIRLALDESGSLHSLDGPRHGWSFNPQAFRNIYLVSLAGFRCLANDALKTTICQEADGLPINCCINFLQKSARSRSQQLRVSKIAFTGQSSPTLISKEGFRLELAQPLEPSLA